jgi:hypothetical protein
MQSSHPPRLRPSWPYTYDALHANRLMPARAEQLCNAITPSEEDQDPAGGEGYLSTILKTVKMDGEAPSTMHAASDYSTSAQKELTIREQTAGLVCFSMTLRPGVAAKRSWD